MVTQGFKIPTIAILSVLIIAVCYDGIHLAHDKRFNHALATDDIAGISGSDGPHRQFAIAYDLQQQREFKAAVNAYAAIDALSGSQLQMHIKYNLANLYFREATRLREAGANDLAMPLIELAKQNYEELLRIDNGHWDAKYNLELALFVAPETDPADTLEERNPEHSPRALTKIRLREPLP
jgi:mxaK protein